MPFQPHQPDFERAAATLDRLLPLSQPVTDALLERLPGLEPVALVLDVACGTGEPGLTLARREPDLQVLGGDMTPAMIEVARRKAASEPVPNARFEVMAAERLELKTGSVAAVISQNGLLLFGEPVTGAAEMARVLSPGGAFSLAVWDRVQPNTLMTLTLRTLAEVMPQNELPSVDGMDDLATPGRREQWLRDAGLQAVNSDLLRYTTHLADFAALRALTQASQCGPLFARLDADRRAQAYGQMEALASEFRAADGSYQVPMAFRLIWGSATVDRRGTSR